MSSQAVTPRAAETPPTAGENLRIGDVARLVGTTPRTVDQTSREYSRYRLCRGRTNTALGQRRSASAELIAEWIPKRRAT